MTIASVAVAASAIAEDTRASKIGGSAPSKRKITAHDDAELIPEPR